MNIPMGPIEALYRDPEVSEIMIDGPNLVRIEKKGEVIDTKVRFNSTDELAQLVSLLHGAQGESAGSIQESRLSDGSRVTSVSGRAAIGGPFVLIVKPRKQAVTWEMLRDWGFLGDEGIAILRNILSKGNSLLVAGSAGSGVATSMSVFSTEIDPAARVIGVEGRAPLELRHPHVITLLASADKRPWVTAALKLRADAIVIGELDGPEAHDIVRAAQERTQIIAAIRANGVPDALRRLELYSLQANVAWSMADHRAQIASSIRFVVHQDWLRDQNRRVIREVTEVTGFANGHYQLEPLMRWNEQSDRFEVTPRAKPLLK